MRILLLVAIALCCCAHPTRVARDALKGEPTLRVTTYNLNYGIAGDGATLAAIGKGAPDVVFLQETTPAWESSIRAKYAARFPFMSFHHCCGAGGLAVLSRDPLRTVDILAAVSGWFPAQRVVIDSPVGRLQVLNVHLHPPVSPSGSFVEGYFTTDAVREAEVKAFHAQLEPGVPTLLVGDFNEPDGPAVRFLQDHGFRSGLPEFAPGKKTWRWRLPVGALGSRLDHIFYSPQLEPLSVEVLEVGRSDHLPVTAVFARAAHLEAKVVQRSPGSVSIVGR